MTPSNKLVYTNYSFAAAVTLTHPLNFFAGWSLIGLAFASGAIIGTRFHRKDFLGGYASLARRLVRLGHIAFAAMGMLNVLFAISPVARNTSGDIASICWLVGGIAMPAVCFLSAWREPMRRLFFIPVVALLGAVALTLFAGAT